MFQADEGFPASAESLIIRYAHQINHGELPYIDSPFHMPEIWKQCTDCLFLDSDEATQEQLSFISKIKKYHDLKTERAG